MFSIAGAEWLCEGLVSDERGQVDTVLITVRIFDFMLKPMGSNGSKRVT